MAAEPNMLNEHVAFGVKILSFLRLKIVEIFFSKLYLRRNANK